MVDFFCMGTTNVTSSKYSGLKRLLNHAVPLDNWVGCGNQKVNLCFKHLLNYFLDDLSANTMLLALWKFFHYHLLAINFLKNVTDAYDKCHVTQVRPTRQTVHDRACKNLCRV